MLRRAIDARRGVRVQLRVHLRAARRGGARARGAGAAAVPAAAAWPAGRRRRRAAPRVCSPLCGSPSVESQRSCSSAESRCRRAAVTSRPSTSAATSTPSRTTASARAGPAPTATASSTRARRSAARSRGVLELLVAHGADPDILVEARPHIGSNRLPRVVTALRATLGWRRRRDSFRDARVTELLVDAGRVRAVRLADGSVVEGAAVILATGHTARDVYAFVGARGRAARRQAVRGRRARRASAAADRPRAVRTGRAPLHVAGGVLSARRDRRRPRRLLVLHVSGRLDRAGDDGARRGRRERHVARAPRLAVREQRHRRRARARGRRGARLPGAMGGVALQASLERAASESGGGAQVAPAQRLSDFVAGRASADLPRCSYVPGVRAARLDARSAALRRPSVCRRRCARFARTVRGYDTRDAVVGRRRDALVEPGPHRARHRDAREPRAREPLPVRRRRRLRRRHRQRRARRPRDRGSRRCRVRAAHDVAGHVATRRLLARHAAARRSAIAQRPSDSISSGRLIRL